MPVLAPEPGPAPWLEPGPAQGARHSQVPKAAREAQQDALLGAAQQQLAALPWLEVRAAAWEACLGGQTPQHARQQLPPKVALPLTPHAPHASHAQPGAPTAAPSWASAGGPASPGMPMLPCVLAQLEHPCAALRPLEMSSEAKLPKAPPEAQLEQAPLAAQLEQAPLEAQLEQAPPEAQLEQAPQVVQLEQAPRKEQLEGEPQVAPWEEALLKTPWVSRLVLLVALLAAIWVATELLALEALGQAPRI
mmetsp:Transcript_115792/g.352134  ORF Transcript_115792/g.352134 Transcript_115792/m.352134 type:complete len:249 (+) Transcript_115792:651-1397(+)